MGRRAIRSRRGRISLATRRVCFRDYWLNSTSSRWGYERSLTFCVYSGLYMLFSVVFAVLGSFFVKTYAPCVFSPSLPNLY